MADLSGVDNPESPTTRDDSGGRQQVRDRGQILLVAAFALAVAFVALALVANSAIYTENLATRASGEEPTTALIVRDNIEHAVGDALRRANERNATSFASIDAAVQVGMTNLSAWTTEQQALGSALTTVSYLGSTQGTRISQSTPGQFISSNASRPPEADWTVVESVSATRGVELRVTDTSALETADADKFTLRASNAAGTATWELRVGKTASGAVEVTVERDNPTATETCVAPASGPVAIDVTGATIDGETCPALDVTGGVETHFRAGVSTPYTVAIENGDAIEGTYRLVVDNATLGTNPDLSAGVGDPDTTDTQPHAYPAMYGVTVELSYFTDVVEYRTEIRAEPGEPT